MYFVCQRDIVIWAPNQIETDCTDGSDNNFPTSTPFSLKVSGFHSL